MLLYVIFCTLYGENKFRPRVRQTGRKISTDVTVTDDLFMYYSDIFSHHVYFRAVSTFFQLAFVSLANGIVFIKGIGKGHPSHQRFHFYIFYCIQFTCKFSMPSCMLKQSSCTCCWSSRSCCCCCRSGCSCCCWSSCSCCCCCWSSCSCYCCQSSCNCFDRAFG